MGAHTRTGRSYSIAGLVKTLGCNEIGCRQLLHAGQLTFGSTNVDLNLTKLALGAGQIGIGGLQLQARFVVFLTGQNLAGSDHVAFLNQNIAHDAAATGCNLNDATLNVDLAVGNRRIGAFDFLFFLSGFFSFFGGAGLLEGAEADDEYDQQHEADPEPFVF